MVGLGRVWMVVCLMVGLAVMMAPAIAQSPLTTVLSKSKKSASIAVVKLLTDCAAPKPPIKVAAGITLVSSNIVIDRVGGREVHRRTYRFSHTLDKVLPELERTGGALRFESPGDLQKQAVGAVWHEYNRKEGLMSVRELICSRIDS